MSGRYVGMVLRGTPGLDPSAKLVLVAHAERAGHQSGGVSWPSVPTISAETGLSQGRVKAIRHKLVADGYLSVVQASIGGPGNTTRYKLNLLRMAESMRRNSNASNTVSSRKTVSRVAPSPANNGIATGGNGAAGKPNGVAREGQTVSQAIPEPVLNRNITGSEPARARDARNAGDVAALSQTLLKKIPTSEPEGHMTREQQIEAARKLAQQKS